SVGGGLLLFALLGPGDLTQRGPARAVAMLPLGVILAAVLFATTLRDPRRHRVIEVLRTNPGRVRSFRMTEPPRPPWTRSARLRAIPGIVRESTLELDLDDGKRLSFPVQAGTERTVLDVVASVVKSSARA